MEPMIYPEDLTVQRLTEKLGWVAVTTSSGQSVPLTKRELILMDIAYGIGRFDENCKSL